jgi:hypothetical protein
MSGHGEESTYFTVQCKCVLNAMSPCLLSCLLMCFLISLMSEAASEPASI